MSATVFRGGSLRKVKNLGWLIRNWRDVHSFAFIYAPSRSWDGQLVANLRGGGQYRTDFASVTVAAGWVDRPIFRTLEFVVVTDSGTLRHRAGTYPCIAYHKTAYAKHLLDLTACKASEPLNNNAG